jgi:hypothetical protein
MNFIGKILFPRSQPWRRERQMKSIFMALLTGLIFAAIVAGVILLRNYRPM